MAVNPMMMSLLQGPNPTFPQVGPATPPINPGAPAPNTMGGIMGNPLFSMGLGLLGGNYGRNKNAAFSNAMRGGLLGLESARRNQLVQQQTVSSQQRAALAQQQFQLAQQKAEQAKKEKEAYAQWVNSLPPQEQALARGNPDLYKARQVQIYQQQYAPPAAPTAAPANVREWQHFQGLSPAEKQQYLAMKRSQQWINTGAQQVMPNPLDPTQPAAVMQNTLAPNELPETKARQAAAVKEGTAQGTAVAGYKDQLSRLPRLHALADELSALGKVATYTTAGQAMNTAKRELGLNPGEGAIARKEYISKVDNEILPLLRQTFGAQFTEKEGQSLKATLGDPNASPEEKDAVLRSFIRTKEEELQVTAARVGAEPESASPAVSRDAIKPGMVMDGYRYTGGDPGSQNSWVKQ